MGSMKTRLPLARLCCKALSVRSLLFSPLPPNGKSITHHPTPPRLKTKPPRYREAEWLPRVSVGTKILNSGWAQSPCSEPLNCAGRLNEKCISHSLEEKRNGKQGKDKKKKKKAEGRAEVLAGGGVTTGHLVKAFRKNPRSSPPSTGWLLGSCRRRNRIHSTVPRLPWAPVPTGFSTSLLFKFNYI